MRELRPTHFDELVKSADIIAVAKVTRVVEIDDNRIGEAVVLVPVVGVKEGQHLTIAGYKTWMCDATGIVQGECALFFLNRKDNRPSDWAALQDTPEPSLSAVIPLRQSISSWQRERYLKSERHRKQLF